MKLRFNHSAHIAGIGLVPWSRLGPERWFPNYKVASLYGWDLADVDGSPEIIALTDHLSELPQLAKFNSQHVLDTPTFQKLVTDHLPAYDLLTYRPIIPPKTLLEKGHRFLSMDKTLTTSLENKVEFRAMFADLGLPFPPYKVVQAKDLKADGKTLQGLLEGRKAVILQDESLSGGKGTFVVKDIASLAYALSSRVAIGGGKRFVISDHIQPAYERSVQCVVTRYGTFVGPLQKQIIAHPLLANLQVADGDRFCGGEISPHDTLQSVYPQIKGYAMTIGKRLQKMGYKGIFSLDCLVNNKGRVYVLEINPRLTGMTPLVTMLYREGQDIPFYLLHILENAGMDYEIEDDYLDPIPPAGSLMVLHSPHTSSGYIIKIPGSGMYSVQDISFTSRQYRLDMKQAGRHMLVQQYTPPGFKTKPGGRVLTVLVNGRILDDRDKLMPDAKKAAQTLLGQVSFKKEGM